MWTLQRGGGGGTVAEPQTKQSQERSWRAGTGVQSRARGRRPFRHRGRLGTNAPRTSSFLPRDKDHGEPYRAPSL